ncbi:hypothetical protein [Pedobacter sp. SYSU D00535]|uniref:hypothetical protein n=1 Tax=Pedobacter sp. SYSU D00535 TaxID=2810308 RepID=UPI001A9705D0|nr:hypothetical protein [Pedobacter sp. SYSU D00535]
MLAKCKKPFFRLLLFCSLALLLLSAFGERTNFSDQLRWIQQCLSTCFDAAVGKQKLKKWDLVVTEKGFFRLRKYFPNGKQEYFSFHLKRFDELSFLGTSSVGELVIKTVSDDIIVQTYNDPRGNIDSMTSVLKLPVVHVEPEQLDSLETALEALK